MSNRIVPQEGLQVISGSSANFNKAPLSQPAIVTGAIIALTVMLGLETVRVLIPSLFWVLGNSLHFDSIQVGLIGMATFLLAFAAIPLLRLKNTFTIILVTAGGLGILRLLLQIWGNPLGNFILAAAGTGLFVVFIPVIFEYLRRRDGLGAPVFIFGLLIGLLLDSVINGAFNTYDISWQSGIVPILVTLVAVGALGFLLLKLKKFPGRVMNDDNRSTTGSFAWIAIGPFLFLQLEVMQSIPRVAVLTGWALPAAAFWVIFCQLAGLGAAALLMSRSKQIWLPLAIGSGLILVTSLLLPGYQNSTLSPIVFAAIILVGQISMAIMLTVIVAGVSGATGKVSRSGVAAANGIGMLLFVILVFGYYAPYDMSLPYSNTVLEPIAAVLISICALGAAIIKRSSEVALRPAWSVPAISLALLVFPLMPALTWHTPEPVAGEGFPIRIMNYNLASGFSRGGDLNMENIALVIEDSKADVVALQEVSRGWLVSGRMDMLTWLSQRLDMPYVSGPTMPLWGNAILSRYPIIEYENFELQPRSLRLLRGFTTATIDLGGGQHLEIITTHLHQINEEPEIRQDQVKTILKIWNHSGSTVFLGDLNADPEDPEMEMLRQAGLIDCAAAVSEHPATTTVDDRRLDYIWISPDLSVTAFTAINSDASDHLPIVAEIKK